MELLAFCVGKVALLYMTVGFGVTLVDCIEDVILTRRVKQNEK